MTLLVPEVKFSIGKSPTTAPAASATNVDMSLGKFDAYKRENDLTMCSLAGHSCVANWVS